MLRLRSHRDQSGAAALEFGLIAGFIFLPLVLGMLQYGWYFYVAQTAGGAASHVARRLAVGDCWTGTQAQSFVQREVGARASDTSLTMSPTSLAGVTLGTTPLTVTVTTKANVVGFWPMPHSGTITRTVSTVLEDNVSSGSC
jgi:Flp pilus assembly protein TadG